ARGAGQKALDLGIERDPVREVLSLFRERLGLVGQRAVGDAEAARDGVARAELADLAGRRRVRLDVPVRLGDRLIDAAEIRLAVGRARGPVRTRLPEGRRRGKRQHGDRPDRTDTRAPEPVFHGGWTDEAY